MANIQTSALMGSCQKPGFSLIPDTRNTRWFWKLIGYGSGIEKYFGFGSGIGYPLVPADMAARMQTLYHGHSEDNHKKKLKCHISDQIKASRHEGLGDRHQRQMFWLWLPVCSCERPQWRNQVKMLLMSRSVSSHASQYLQSSTSSLISVT